MAEGRELYEQLEVARADGGWDVEELRRDLLPLRRELGFVTEALLHAGRGGRKRSAGPRT